MIKLFAIAFSITAIALSSSFAECSGGGCDKGGEKGKEPAKEPVTQSIQF